MTADAHDGGRTPGYTVSSSQTIEGDMPDGFGVRNGEAITRFTAGEHVYYGAFAVPLSVILDSCHAEDYGAVNVSMTSSGALPCVAVVSSEYVRSPWTEGGHYVGSGIIASFTAVSWASAVKAYPQEGNVVIDGVRHPISDALVVFGQAQYSGSGSYVDSVTVSLLAEPVVMPKYMDPTKGVQPYQGTYVTSDVQVTNHAGSRTPSLSLAFSNRYGDHVAETIVTGEVSLTVSQTVTTAFSFEFIAGTNGVSRLQTTVGGTTATANGTSGALTLLMIPQGGGTFSLAVGEDAMGTFAVADAEVSSITVSSTSYGNVGTLEAVATKDSGDAVTHSGFGTWEADLSYRTTAGTETTVGFDKAYWRNGYDNSVVTMAFTSGENESKSARLTLFGSSASSYWWIDHDATGWKVRTYAEPGAEEWHEIGMWPAIEVEFRPTGATVYPVSEFKTFVDYKTIAAPTEIPAPGPSLGTIRSLVAFSTGYDMRMGVTGTVTHIAKGGLYLQNGVFTLRDSFPSADAVSITIGSTAHLGDSITFSGNGSSVTLPVNPDRTVTIGTQAYPLNGMTFRWYSAAGPTATIGGQAFAPAVYHRGQSYAAGSIWAEVKGGQMVLVLADAGDWTMTLDGVWAPAVNLYDGHNVAAEKTELADWTHGVFRWDANTFLVVMMGVVVLGGVVGAYLKMCATADWIVIGAAVAIMWLIL